MPISETISIDDALEVLNRFVNSDRDAATELMLCKVNCNQAVADDPTIQVRGYDLAPGVVAMVGPLGLLNGLFGATVAGWGAIAGKFEVVCPNGCDGIIIETVRDNCKKCGEQLQLGKLIEFIRTEQSKTNE